MNGDCLPPSSDPSSDDISRRRAALITAHFATDADDLRQLLDMLGLLDTEPAQECVPDEVSNPKHLHLAAQVSGTVGYYSPAILRAIAASAANNAPR
ncbi:hypothetical protein ONR57_06500 [Hoyosella sp. YIM 151337]|uniref:hypothetical protein n=1 Tax=Hoyosella sp. YIM 151337 TaxID=2992742 RepID=UPI00223675CE|nr:hypothetical protein [Hoyosella sp. YIM 151337]MCW4352943.1 hypothetical protein [Hoyosella sp. YIM 151337]